MFDIAKAATAAIFKLHMVYSQSVVRHDDSKVSIFFGSNMDTHFPNRQ